MADSYEDQKQKIINQASYLVPDAAFSSSNSIVISNDFYYLYQKIGDYAFKFAKYDTDFHYNTFSVSGAADIGPGSSSEYVGPSIQGSFNFSFSGFDQAYLETSLQPAYGLGVSEDNLGQTSTTEQWSLFGILNLKGSGNQTNSDTSATVGLDLKRLLLEIEFFQSEGEAAGFMSSVGTNLGDAFSMSIGVGRRYADHVLYVDNNFLRSWSWSTEPDYNALKDFFPNISVPADKFLEMVKANYLYGSTSNYYEALGETVYELLKGDTPSDASIFADRASVQQLMQAEHDIREADGTLSSFTGYSVVLGPGDAIENAQLSEQNPLSEEAVIMAVKNAAENKTSENVIAEGKAFDVTIIKQDGTSEVISLNPAEQKILDFENAVADAEVNGTIISQTSGTAVHYGVNFDSVQTLYEHNGSQFLVTEFQLPSNSVLPSNGVRYQKFVVEVDAATGEYVRESEVTQFIDSAGYIHNTLEQKDGVDGNWVVRDNTLNPLDNVTPGATYIVPSSNLLAALQGFGGTAGSMLGSYLADGDVYKDIIYSTFLKSVTQHFGTFTAYLASSTSYGLTISESMQNGLDAALGGDIQGTIFQNADFSETFFSNLNSKISSTLAGLIVDEVGDALDIGGVAGDLFDVVGTTVTTQFLSETIDVVFGNLDGTILEGLADGLFFKQQIWMKNDVPVPEGTEGATLESVDINIQSIVVNALASYVGSHLAGELIQPESQQAAIFGSIGSSVAAFVAGANAAAGSTLATIQAALQLGTAFGPVGIAVAAFIGTVAGTALGNLFGNDADHPATWARVKYDYEGREFYVRDNVVQDGADHNISEFMADRVAAGINAIIASTGGALRSTSKFPAFSVGWSEGKFSVDFGEGERQTFDKSGDAINYAVLHALKNFDLVGGHAIVMRAWHNSDATTLEEFRDDIEVAEAFQQYLMNPTGILALMMDQPDSEVAQAWAAILQRAAEMELHLPSEYDLDGGWSELLYARGDIDPELIPNIEGDSIVLTDPFTGEEITLHHVIGPGYEMIRIEGTDGNDILQVNVDGPSIAYVSGDAGDDIINGGPGDDVLVGGDGDDIISGNAGKDWINGGYGEDTLDGGIGDDLIVGGPDDDILLGGEGMDYLYGGAGNDTLDGQGVTDRLYGGAGDDTLYGYAGTERTVMHGEDGNDTLYGLGYDDLHGDKGDDTFILSSHKNYIYVSRDQGNDTIITTELDTVNTNILIFDHSVAVNELWAYQDPSNSRDVIIAVLGENQSIRLKDYLDENGNVAIDNFKISVLTAKGIDAAGAYTFRILASDLATVIPTGPNNIITDIQALTDYEASHPHWQTQTPDTTDWSVVYGDAGDNTISGNDYDNQGNNVHDYNSGGAGNDVMSGSNGEDYLIGGLGDDVMSGETGWDYFWGGAGNDTIMGQDGGDTMHGGWGNDTIYGGNHTDHIFGDQGNDILYGQDHEDLLVGGAGDDYMDGGDADDILYGDEGNDTLIGGAGDDSVYGDAGDDILEYTMALNVGAEDTYNGGVGTDTLRLRLTSLEFADDAVQRDILRLKDQVVSQQISLMYTFAAFALVISNIEVFEVFVDGLLQDVSFTEAQGTEVADILNLGAEHDRVHAGAGDDAISGGSGQDDLYGGEGNDTIHGGLGMDEIYGEDGDDALYGDEGDDIIDAGEGDDIAEGGAGDDVIFGGAGNDTLSGNDGVDILRGESGDDVISGGAGNDILEGGSGNDTLVGGEGADSLSGGEGDDELEGGIGNDKLYGGTGSDTYFYNLGDGSDVIDDSAGIEDQLIFGAGITAADLFFGRVNVNDLEISIGSSGDKITIAGQSVATGIKSIEWIVFDDATTIDLLNDDSLFAFDDAANIQGYDPIDIDVLANDFTYQADALSVSAVGDALYGSVLLNADGTITYTPDAGFYGNDSFSYEVSDGAGGTASANVSVSVDPGNLVLGTLGNDSLSAVSGMILDGGAGDDVYTLTGGGNEIRISRGDGNDTFYGNGQINTIVFAEDISINELWFDIIGNDLRIDILGVDQSITVKNAFGRNGIDYGSNRFFVQAEGGELEMTGNNGQHRRGDNVFPRAYLGHEAYTNEYGVDYGYFTGPQGANNYMSDAAMLDRYTDMAQIGSLFAYHRDPLQYGWEATSDPITVRYMGQSTNDAVSEHIYGSQNADTITVGGGNDTVYGSIGNDTITGSDVLNSDDRLYGDSGNDVLYGGLGNDLLVGGLGSDTLTGGAGADTLIGGTDADTNVGGAGNDVYVFSKGDGADTISDISGADIIKLAGGIVLADLSFENVGDDLIISFVSRPSDQITVLGQNTGSVVEKLLFDDGSHFNLTSLIPVQSDPPSAADDVFAGVEDLIIMGNVLADNGNGVDSDPEGDTLSVVAGTYETIYGGNLVLSANGDFIYTPTLNFNGADSFVYTLQDEYGKTDTGQITLNLSPVNDNPIAVGDVVNVEQDTATSLNVLANDTDVDGDVLSVMSVTAAQHGAVSIHTDGTIIYTPDAGFYGSDSFSYEVSDGAGGTASANVSVSVDPSNLILGTSGNDSLSALSGMILDGGAGNDTYTLSGGGNEIRISRGDGNDIFYGNSQVNMIVFAEDISPNELWFEIVGNDMRIDVLGENQSVLVKNAFSGNGTSYGSNHFFVMASGGEIEMTGNNGQHRRGDSTYPQAFLGRDAYGNQYGTANHYWDGPEGTDNYLTDAQLLERYSDLPSIGAFTNMRDPFNGTGWQGHTFITPSSAGDDNDTDYIAGTHLGDTITVGGGDDVVYAGIGNDTITGSDILNSDDSLYGDSGNDVLYGGLGNDLLVGGLGSDTLTGGAGADTLIGGADADTFNFDALDGAVDIITDFNAAEGDKIDIADLLSGYDPLSDAISDFIQISQSGADSIVSVDVDGGADHFVEMALLLNTTGLTDVEVLDTNGTIIA